ncbi:MAG: hypothetical protein Q4D38_13875 [Planctomycetia bacterium]|nr:hypothetical protein [Planctomycetia bacterium]
MEDKISDRPRDNSQDRFPRAPLSPNELVRERDGETIIFPCDPNHLRNAAIGLRTIFWANLVMLFVFATCLAWGAYLFYNSEISGFFEEMYNSAAQFPLETIEGQQEMQEMIMKRINVEIESGSELSGALTQFGLIVGAGFFLLLLGSLMKLIGAVLCATTPKSVVPAAAATALAPWISWFLYLFLGTIPSLAFLSLAVLLCGFYFWTVFLRNTSLAINSMRLALAGQVFWNYFCFSFLMLFLCMLFQMLGQQTTSPGWFKFYSLATYTSGFMSVGLLFCALWLYMSVLWSLPNAIWRMVRFWNEE